MLAGSEKINITIIGAGIIGLAAAYHFSQKFPELDVLVVEKNDSFGQETSSRNSEVVHAGIYYEKGSLKAKLCVEGKHLIKQFCQENKVRFKELGKLIVAHDQNEEKELAALFLRGKENGVDDLQMLTKKELEEKTGGNVKGVAAIFSPSTAIIDTHGVMKALEYKFRQQGGMVHYRSEVIGIEKKTDGYEIKLANDESFLSEMVVNASGLRAHKVAQFLGVNGDKVYFYKGEYFSWNGKNPLKYLVYPVPGTSHGLGIHSVQDLAGNLKFGPNSFYIGESKAEDMDYSVNSDHKADFFNSAKKILPWVTLNDMSPDQAGIRAKLRGPGESQEKDFIIREEEKLAGFIDLVGIESPGFTASLAIAKYVGGMVKKEFLP